MDAADASRINYLSLPTPMATRAIFIILFSTIMMFQSGGVVLFRVFLLNDTPTSNHTVISGGILYIVIFYILLTIDYLTHPLRQRRAFGSAAELTRDSSARSLIKALCDEHNVQVSKIWVSRDIGNASAITFGIGKDAELLITRGMEFLSVKCPTKFNAKISHELGHIKSRDALYVFAILAAVRWVTTILATSSLFFVVSNILIEIKFNIKLNQSHFYTLLSLLIFFIFTCVPLFLFMKSFIRVRELYADGFSRILVGSDAIDYTLGAQCKPNRFAYVRNMLSNHPIPFYRKACIRNPLLGASTSAASLFLTGVITAATLSSAYNLNIFSTMMQGYEIDYGNGVAEFILAITEVIRNHPYELFVFSIFIFCFYIATIAIIMDIIRDVIIRMAFKGFCVALTESAALGFSFSIGFALGIAFFSHIITMDPDISIEISDLFRTAVISLVSSTLFYTIFSFFSAILALILCRSTIKRVTTLGWIALSTILIIDLNTIVTTSYLIYFSDYSYDLSGFINLSFIFILNLAVLYFLFRRKRVDNVKFGWIFY